MESQRGAVDHRDRAAQLVGGHGEQMGALVDEALALLLVLALLGLVAGDLREADVLTGIVVDSGDHDAGPEAASVPAHPPALLGVASVPQRLVENVLGVSGGLGLRGVEHPEVPTDDLGGVIALDALRPVVPGGHAAPDVEHEDRVLTHGVDQSPEALLGAAEVALDGPLGGDVLHLREHVERLPLGVTDRGEGHPRDPRRLVPLGRREAVLERGRVHRQGDEVLEPAVELVALAQGQPTVVDSDELAGSARHESGEGAVGSDDGAARGQGRHPDLGAVEEVSELLDVSRQGHLPRVVLCCVVGPCVVDLGFGCLAGAALECL